MEKKQANVAEKNKTEGYFYYQWRQAGKLALQNQKERRQLTGRCNGLQIILLIQKKAWCRLVAQVPFLVFTKNFQKKVKVSKVNVEKNLLLECLRHDRLAVYQLRWPIVRATFS